MPILDHYFEHKKDKNDFLVSVVVILFFGLGIAYFLTSKQQENLSFNKPFSEKNVLPIQAKSKETQPTLAPIILHQSIQKKQDHWLGKLEMQGIANTSISTSTTGDSLSAENMKEQDNLLTSDKPVQSDSINLQVSDQTPLEEYKDSSLQEIKVSDSLQNSEVFDSVNTVTLVEEVTLNNSDSCAIFIGAFKSKTNARELLEQIRQDQQYSTFSNYERGYQVVGIRVSCDQELSRQMLKTIQRKYSRDAWFAPIR